MKTTTVINLFAGPSVGKSTFAAELFTYMKKNSYDVEMVREWIKLWAWEGKKMTVKDQIFVFANQIHEETTLYNKVQYLITDSPIILSPFYEKVNYGSNHMLSAAKAIMTDAENNDVVYRNVFLNRTRKYQPNGRFQTETQAKLLDRKLESFLKTNKLRYEYVSNIYDILIEFIQ